MTTVYHGTPLTPRAALVDVCTGRAMCVSFFRPDDVEVVEAISPAVMFRQRRVLILDAGSAARCGSGRGGEARLVGLLCVARAAAEQTRPLGGDPRPADGTVAGQRRPAQRLALRPARRAGVAHGRAARSTGTALRAVRAGLPWVDRRPEEGAGRVRRVSAQDGRGCGAPWQHMAGAAHAPRNGRCLRLPLRQRGQHLARTERMAL